MTTHRGQFPTKKLKVDLDQVDLSQTGFWWCRRCHRVTELMELENGLTGRRCTHCHSRKIEWKPELQEGPVSRPEPLPDWVVEPGQDARPRQKLHRLPQEKRDLRVLARTGYFFCYGCKQITERNEQESCVLCKSSEVEWNDPVYKEAS